MDVFIPLWLFQFTHPGGLRRELLEVGVPQTSVSIHAPGRGATGAWRASLLSVRPVSIHAPGRGATSGHSSNS